jgi:hypothetical protein
VTCAVLQAEISPLKLLADKNMQYMVVTCPVLQADRSPLKELAAANVASMALSSLFPCSSLKHQR